MLSEPQKQQLHKIAENSIENGLISGEPLIVKLNNIDQELQTKRATFVTLHKHKQLRGCIGILEPLRCLADDVSYNAYAAAFKDKRFNPVTENEIDQLDIHISILGSPEPVDFSSESNLVSLLRPGIDGLIMEEGGLHGTFLPSVWASVPDRQDFLNHLKLKTGLPKSYWSNDIKIQRYTVEDI